MSKFKVGDIVKRIQDNLKCEVMEEFPQHYRLRRKNKGYIDLAKRYVDISYKLAYRKIKDTELARKMYPKHEVDGEYLIVEVE
jgi:hypothetical protein